MFETLNYAEAALWFVIGLVFLVSAFRTPSQDVRLRNILLASTFLAFGGSDIVEVHTGAWWRPLWLLAWKTVCVLILLHQFVRYRQSRREFP
jgi:phosphoglycerol transferase MdoB-like AlkP superfamily enzyme